MSNESSKSSDLASIDLSLSFAPAWAKEADPAKQIARLAAKHGGDDRGDRHDKRRDGGRDFRDDRRPPRGGGGKRPERGGGRPPRRDDRRPEPRPQREIKPEPTLTGWEVRFLPDRHGVDGLARQIKTSAKAYPLFDLARLVLEKSERYVVELKRTAESATDLFQLKADGSLWLSEGDAISHALATQLDKYYRRERVTVEPPKGVYPFVAVCGMSGTVLGPPNYHDYQTKIRRLHAERFANMPFEVYKNRIRMERDETFIAQWKEEQSSKDLFYPIDRNAPAPAPVEIPEATETAETPAVEANVPPSEGEEMTEGTEATETPETPEAPEATESAETTAEAPTEPAEKIAPVEKGPSLASLSEVEQHFREHSAATEIVKIRDRVVAPGPAALNDSAPAVLQLTRGLWEHLDRFPLPLAHSLGQQLSARGLQIFKAHENITYVGVARPRYLDRVTTPVSEAFSAMLDYLESHAATPRPEQWQALVELRGPIAEGAEHEREATVARDLSWLLHEGHVIDYIKRGLEVTVKAKPATPQKGTSPKKATAQRNGPKSPVSVPQSTPDDAAPPSTPEPVDATPQITPEPEESAPENLPVPADATSEAAPEAETASSLSIPEPVNEALQSTPDPADAPQEVAPEAKAPAPQNIEEPSAPAPSNAPEPDEAPPREGEAPAEP